MITTQTVTIIGITGAAIILVAFILNQTHRWKENELRYDLTNLIGSFLLVIYAYLLKSYPFFVLNFVWFVVSLRDVVGDLKRK